MMTGSTRRRMSLGGGVVGADEGALGGVERALEERAEDGGLDVRPVVPWAAALRMPRSAWSSSMEWCPLGRKEAAVEVRRCRPRRRSRPRCSWPRNEERGSFLLKPRREVRRW